MSLRKPLFTAILSLSHDFATQYDKNQSAVDQWFTVLFMRKSRKDYDMKTNIIVVSCFDGSMDATDVFTDIIAERSKYTGVVPPFGYLKDHEQKGHLIIDEETAWIVRKIYDYAMENKGSGYICRRLEKEKFISILNLFRKSQVPTIQSAPPERQVLKKRQKAASNRKSNIFQQIGITQER